MSKVVVINGKKYDVLPSTCACKGCAFSIVYPGETLRRCTNKAIDCMHPDNVIYKRRIDFTIVNINGKMYKKEECTMACRGCVFSNGNDTCAEDCTVYKTTGCSGIIYKEAFNIWIDLSWLKGTARRTISDAVQQQAIDNGWHWRSTDGILNSLDDAFIVLTADGRIESWYEKHKEVLDSYENLHEITVNDALNGSYKKPKKKYVPYNKMGDAANLIGKVVKNKENGAVRMLTSMYMNNNECFINDLTGDMLLNNYTFLDGTPCGLEAVE